MKRIAQASVLLATILLIFILLNSNEKQPQATQSDSFAIGEVLHGDDTQTFALVGAPRKFIFPADFGSHDEYRTEWWYFTGNNEDASGRRFGYQLTFFRFSPRAQPASGQSRWRSSQLYMAHLALTDIAQKRMHTFERFSRGAADLAGTKSSGLQVWLDDWSARSETENGFPLHIKASEGDVSIALTLQQGKPVVLHGDGGISIKNSEPGNASYYYSYTRMPTEGNISIDGESYRVSGNSWMDREWSSSALGKDQLGWDWFALQLSNGHELMYYRFRRPDNTPDPFSYGALVSPDGKVNTLSHEMIKLEVNDRWTSAATGVAYPAAWRLQVPAFDLDLQVESAVPDQELALSFRYWEGSVDVRGEYDGDAVTGRGYVELTGYSKTE